MDKEISKRIDLLKDKYDAIGQDLETHLDGLLQSKPITYWDYIQTDALLNLQVQRTLLPDEMVFIMYHQINELIFKMILWEIQQVSHHPAITTDFFVSRLKRISRYFDMLSESFSIPSPMMVNDSDSMSKYLLIRCNLDTKKSVVMAI